MIWGILLRQWAGLGGSLILCFSERWSMWCWKTQNQASALFVETQTHVCEELHRDSTKQPHRPEYHQKIQTILPVVDAILVLPHWASMLSRIWNFLLDL